MPLYHFRHRISVVKIQKNDSSSYILVLAYLTSLGHNNVQDIFSLFSHCVDGTVVMKEEHNAPSPWQDNPLGDVEITVVFIMVEGMSLGHHL